MALYQNKLSFKEICTRLYVRTHHSYFRNITVLYIISREFIIFVILVVMSGVTLINP